MKVTDVVVDASATMGKKLWVVDVVPAYEYVNGQRTQNVTGYRYVTVLPERKMEKISVKIDGAAQMEAPNGYVEVVFDGLEVNLYWANGDYNVSAKATAVRPVKGAA